MLGDLFEEISVCPLKAVPKFLIPFLKSNKIVSFLNRIPQLQRLQEQPLPQLWRDAVDRRGFGQAIGQNRPAPGIAR